MCTFESCSYYGSKKILKCAQSAEILKQAKIPAFRAFVTPYEMEKCDIAEGTASNIKERVASALDSNYESFYQCVIAEKLCEDFAETGWRDIGKRYFV